MYGRNRRSPSPPRNRVGGGGGARHQVLIKNIPFEVDWKKLKDFIKDVAGCDVKFAQIVENKPGRSAGFGFAAFHTSGDMNMAIDRLKRQQLMGREIFIMEDSNQSELERLKEQKGIGSGSSQSDRRSGGGGGESRNSGEPCLHGVPIAQINGLNTLDTETLESLGTGELSNKLFAYNLVYDVNERKLSDVFAMFGEVRDLVVPKKGHAIIEYRQSSDALRALIILRNQFLDGRKMMIKMDGAPFAKNTDNGRPLEKRPRMDERPSDHHNRAPPPPGGDYRSSYGANRPYQAGPPPPPQSSSAPPPFNHYNSGAPPPPPPPSGGGGMKVCVAGLPLSVTTSLIRQLFESIGPVDYVQLSDGGRCDLEYYDPRHAQDAQHRLNGYLVEGRAIKVYLA